jgi:hypothetical protein
MSAPGTSLASAAGSSGGTSAPWWAHLLIGAAAIGGSIVMYALGNTVIGDSGFIGGLAFLGVGAGVAASS